MLCLLQTDCYIYVWDLEHSRKYPVEVGPVLVTILVQFRYNLCPVWTVGTTLVLFKNNLGRVSDADMASRYSSSLVSN